MQQEIKNKLPLIIALGLPLIFLLWVFIFIYLLPNIFINPSYNFIYVSGYNSNYIYIEDGKIQAKPYSRSGYNENEYSYIDKLDFYLYKVKNDENVPLSFEEAQKYKLDNSEKSPDNYFVKKNTSSSGYFFPFFWESGSGRTYSINKSSFLNKTITIKGNDYYFKFLGWVLE